MSGAERRKRKRLRLLGPPAAGAGDGPIPAAATVVDPTGWGKAGALRRSDIHLLRRNLFTLTEKALTQVPARMANIATRCRPRTAIAASKVLVQMAQHNQKEEAAGLLPGEQRPAEQPQQTVVVNVQQNNEQPLTDEQRAEALRQLLGPHRNGK